MRCPRKRQSILDSAMKVFCEKGVNQAKVEEIAEQAGVAKGTVYLYFKSKQDIIGTVLDEFIAQFFTQVSCLVDRQCPAEEKLLEFIKLELREVSRLAPIIYPELSSIDDAFCRQFMEIQTRMQALLVQILDQGVTEGTFGETDTAYAAFCLQGIIRIHVETWVCGEEKYMPAEAATAQRIYGLFTRALR